MVKVLAGKSPAVRATELTAGTTVGDPKERRKFAESAAKTLAATTDTMIQFARLLDGEARQLRKRHEDEVQEIEQQANAQIARAVSRCSARVSLRTRRLRCAWPSVWSRATKWTAQLAYTTTFGGAFARADKQQHKDPFVLPPRWLEGKKKLDLTTPFNFVSTADTIGGNSGSPVLNRAGELVGINFDRNRHGLVANYRLHG